MNAESKNISPFEEFLNSLKYWLGESGLGYCEVRVEIRDAKTARVMLIDEEDEEETYIGNYADPGIWVEWLGDVSVQFLPNPTFTLVPMVRVNGIVMAAIAKHVAAWASGYDDMAS